MRNRVPLTPILASLIVLLSCSNDDNVVPKNKERLLTKEYLNGTLAKEYVYDLDRKLIKINSYGISLGIYGKGPFAVLSYNDAGSLEQYIRFNKASEATLKYEYSYDPSGRLTRRDYFATSIGNDEISKLDYYTVYTYDQRNQIIRETFRKPDDKVAWYYEFTYDENGNIKSKTTFKLEEDESGFSNSSKDTYEHEDKSLPPHWKIYMREPLDHDFYYFTLLKQESVSYYNNGDYTYTIIGSQRVYDDSGYVISQMITTHSFLPNAPVSSKIYNYSYEYTE